MDLATQYGRAMAVADARWKLLRDQINEGLIPDTRGQAAVHFHWRAGAVPTDCPTDCVPDDEDTVRWRTLPTAFGARWERTGPLALAPEMHIVPIKDVVFAKTLSMNTFELVSGAARVLIGLQDTAQQAIAQAAADADMKVVRGPQCRVEVEILGWLSRVRYHRRLP